MPTDEIWTQAAAKCKVSCWPPEETNSRILDDFAHELHESMRMLCECQVLRTAEELRKTPAEEVFFDTGGIKDKNKRHIYGPCGPLLIWLQLLKCIVLGHLHRTRFPVLGLI